MGPPKGEQQVEQPGGLDPLQAAKAAFKARDFAEAERLANLGPRDVASLGLLGRIQSLTGRGDEAVATLQESLSIDPQRVETLNLLAAAYSQVGKLEEAIATCEEIVRLGHGSSRVWGSIGLYSLRIGNYERAATAFKCAMEGADNLAPLHHHLGVALQRLGRFGEAVDEYKRALAIDPKNVDSWENLGHAAMSLHDPEAPVYFEQGAAAVDAGPGRELLRAKAISFSNGDLDEAEAILRKLTGESPSGAASALLGNILQQMGRFDDAADAFRQAMVFAPGEAGPITALANTRKVRPEDADILERIEALLGSRDVASPDRISLLFAKGKAQNDLGEYEAALNAFADGHRLERELLGVKFSEDSYKAEFDKLIDLYTAPILQQATGSQRELPLLIVGMPRSGTTLADRIISAHHAVGAAGELRFWHEVTSDDVAFIASPELIAKAGADYLGIIGQYGQNKVRVTDKAPWNYEYLGRLLLALPQAKIIHVRRHPVDNCLSLFMTPFDMTPYYAMALDSLVYAYRTYERIMEHWRNVLPPGRMLEIQYSDMIENTEPTARKMVEFCGLDWDEACLHPEANDKEIRTASVWQARQPVNRGSLDRWKRYEPWLGPLRELLPD
jgi:tetratricopeptide (TPR) repeat protein